MVVQSPPDIDNLYRRARSTNVDSKKSEILAHAHEYLNAKRLVDKAILGAGQAASVAPQSAILSQPKVVDSTKLLIADLFGDLFGHTMVLPSLLAALLAVLLFSANIFTKNQIRGQVYAQLAQVGMDMPAEAWNELLFGYAKSLDTTKGSGFPDVERVRFGSLLAQVSRIDNIDAKIYLEELREFSRTATDANSIDYCQQLLETIEQRNNTVKALVQALIQKDDQIFIGYFSQLGNSSYAKEFQADLAQFMPQLKLALEKQIGVSRTAEMFMKYELSPNQKNQIELLEQLNIPRQSREF